MALVGQPQEIICGSAGAAMDCAVQSLMDSTHSCYGNDDVGGLGQLRALCLPSTRLPLVRAAITNSTACEIACPGVLAALGTYQFVQAGQNMRLGALPGWSASRRLAGHGRDIVERHALLGVLCPVKATVECFFGESAGACEFGGSRPEVMDHCNVSMSVTLNMALSVSNAADFVAHANSTMAVANGIAAAASTATAAVDAAVVSVVLSVGTAPGSRRLQETVDVSATILTADAAGATTLQATIAGIAPTALATELNQALATAGVAGVTVTVASTEAVVAPSAEAAAMSTPGSGDTTGDTTTSSAALKQTLSSYLFVVLGAVLLLPCRS